MKRSRLVHVALPVILLVTVTLACNLPGTASDADVNVAATQTMQALETIIAETIQAGGAEGPSEPIELPLTGGSEPGSPTSTATITMTATVTHTPTFTVTPTATLTPTPSIPLVHVSVNTNCRSGPGTVYDYLGGLLEGESAEVVARDETGQYWIIKNPDAPGECWLWGQYATVNGDTSKLPVLTPPPTPTPTPTSTPTPTPTPTPDFQLTQNDLISCYGMFWVVFAVENTGGQVFEAAKAWVIDLNSNVDLGGFYLNTPFMPNANNCPPDPVVSKLEAGATSYVAVRFVIPAPFDNVRGWVMLCTQDFMKGDCVTKSVFVSPE